MFDCKTILNEIKQSGIYGIYGKPRSGKTSISAGIVLENEKRKKKEKVSILTIYIVQTKQYKV